MGQFFLRDTGAIVPDGDDHLIPVPPDGRVDAFSAAAVLGRVVQQIAEDLAHAFRIPGQGRELLLAVEVIQFNALPAEKLPVGIHRVLQLRLDVHGLDGKGKPPVLDTGELQQLLHHVGQPPGLGHNDAHPLLHILRVPYFPVHDGLRPAVDGGEGRAQLMGNRGDEFILQLLRLLDLQGHVVEGVGQITDLVVELLLDLDPVRPGGDPFGGVCDARYRIHDGADEVQVGEVHHTQDGKADAQRDAHNEDDLPVHAAQGGDIPHGPRHPAVDDQRRHICL